MESYNGLAGAEARERAKAKEEEEAWTKVIQAAREQLPTDGNPIPLESFLVLVGKAAHVDLLDAKRALARLRALGEADYKFGVGVSRR